MRQQILVVSASTESDVDAAFATLVVLDVLVIQIIILFFGKLPRAQGFSAGVTANRSEQSFPSNMPDLSLEQNIPQQAHRKPWQSQRQARP
jgi:hypothetical protein